MQNAKIKVQNDRAKVKKFCVLICHFDFLPLIFKFLYCLGFVIFTLLSSAGGKVSLLE
jgi:hypothetical protein